MELEGFSQLEKIAEGGMAVLYKGIQTSLSRPVAIKVMKGTLADTPEAHELFEWESKIVARLDHPHIIRVIDKGLTPQGMPFFVMDYVEGVTLKDALRSNKLSDRRKLRVMIQVAKALGYAHRNNIIHRDIKPGNILLDREGNARVVDFGIARLTEDTELSKVNEAGMTVGTPAYMAPEQQQGASFTTSASDIYSLGVIMYLMLTGKLYKAGYPPPSQHNPKVPTSLDKITMACLADDPTRRPSADKLVALLLTALKGAHLKQEQQEAAKQTFKDAKDKFRLLDIIRETDFGSVCLYENREDRSLMVLKKRHNNFKGFNEAELLSRLKHRNIINVRGVSRNDRIFITVLEYLSGGSLQSRMAQPMAVADFMPIAEQICDAMIFAHNNRIIHGNLRPHNILFDDSNTVKVMDFGFEPHYENMLEQNWYVCDDDPHTIAGDVYAAGVIFYQLLTGALPDWKRGLLQPNEAFGEIPQHLRTLIKGMLCRDSKVRLANFEEVKKGLQLQQDGSDEKTRTAIKPVEAPKPKKRSGRTGMLASVLVLLLLINGGLYLWLYAQKNPLPPWLAEPLVDAGLVPPHPQSPSFAPPARSQTPTANGDKELTMKRVDHPKQN
jgi:serine/threonine-protein kinase